jgi:hypothetical protein
MPVEWARREVIFVQFSQCPLALLNLVKVGIKTRAVFLDHVYTMSKSDCKLGGFYERRLGAGVSRV